MDRIGTKLWLGEIADAYDVEALQRNGITAILSLVDDTSETHEDGILRAGVTISDLQENPLAQYMQAVETIDRLLREGHTVLVHCIGGVSRSPAVVAGYLAAKEGLDPLQAWALIVRRRPVVEPNWDHFRRIQEALRDDG